MGSDVIAGQCLLLHVPGGGWKASQLTNGLAGYGLISEAVSPGFDFADMELGSQQKLSEQFPEEVILIAAKSACNRANLETSRYV